MTPAKSLPMNAFMLWMAGGGIQIFSVLMTGMMLTNAMKTMMNVNSGN